MIRDEMMARMPAREFFERMERERRAMAPTQPVQQERAMQTPQQILDMFPVTKPKPQKERKRRG